MYQECQISEASLTGSLIVLRVYGRVEVEWGKMKAEGCQKLIENMSRRIKAVIKAKGGHTED